MLLVLRFFKGRWSSVFCHIECTSTFWSLLPFCWLALTAALSTSLLLATQLLKVTAACSRCFKCDCFILLGACGSEYPTKLQALLGPNYVVTNTGAGGQTQLKLGLCGPPASCCCSYWGTSQWAQTLQSQPDIVTIMLGTNDAKDFNVSILYDLPLDLQLII